MTMIDTTSTTAIPVRHRVWCRHTPDDAAEMADVRRSKPEPMTAEQVATGLLEVLDRVAR